MANAYFKEAVRDCIKNYGIFNTILINLGVCSTVVGIGIGLVYLINYLIK